MVATKCKSGKHSYDSSQVESLEKCCNGYVRLMKPWGNEETGGYDSDGQWWGVAVFVREDDTAEIERIKALGPIEKRGTVKGPENIM